MRADHRPTLGVFRFALAVIVFWGHVVPRPFQFLYTDIHGYIAVLMFFVLSGFLISNAMETIYIGRVRDFLVNRCLRLYPSFWASLAVMLVICGIFGRITGFSDTLSISGFSVPILIEAPFTFGVVPLAWSLRCEWTFYLTIAAVYLMIGDSRHKDWLVYGGCFAALGFYAYISATSDLPWAHPYLHIPYFVVGVAISRLLLRREPTYAALLLVIAGIVVSIVCFGHLDDIGNVPIPGNPRRLFEPLVFFYHDPLNLWNFGYLFVAFLLGAVIDIGRGSLRQVDNLLGDLTYPLYITHFAIITVVGAAFSFLPDMERVWIAFAAALAFAALLWFFVDHNVIRWRDKVRGLSLYAKGVRDRRAAPVPRSAAPARTAPGPAPAE